MRSPTIDTGKVRQNTCSFDNDSETYLIIYTNVQFVVNEFHGLFIVKSEL